jgi:hypothetical protein
VVALGTARYGAPDVAGDAVRGARTELRRLRKRLRASLGMGDRLRGLVRLRSLSL